LYTRDLYTLDLNADLVVLSACETGIGQLSRGEGSISLSHGFAQAGARSLLNTLWRVSDEASAKMMATFYRYLKDGLPKDEALRRAKLDYLQSARGSERHPFYWGAYTITGDISPVSFTSSLFKQYRYLLFLSVFVFLGVIYWIKRTPNATT
jgi:CHAT domain-containing protein